MGLEKLPESGLPALVLAAVQSPVHGDDVVRAGLAPEHIGDDVTGVVLGPVGPHVLNEPDPAAAGGRASSVVGDDSDADASDAPLAVAIKSLGPLGVVRACPGCGSCWPLRRLLASAWECKKIGWRSVIDLL